MQSTNIFLKIGVLSFFFLLMGSLVAYRAGTFDTALGRVEYEQGDSTIPDSLPLPIMHSSKSMVPIFKEKPKPATLDSFILDSVKNKDERTFNPSSKSGRVFGPEDVIAPSSKSGEVFRPEDLTKPADTKPKKKKHPKKKKPMMSGSKSAAVISPE